MTKPQKIEGGMKISVNYDPNPLKDVSVEQAMYLANSSDPEVRINATYVLSNYQQHFNQKP